MMIDYPPCKKCGKSHGMGIEDRETGDITPIDICHECLWKDWKPKYPPHLNLEDMDVDWIYSGGHDINIWRVILKTIPKSKLKVVPDHPEDQHIADQLNNLLNHYKQETNEKNNPS